MVAGGLVVAMLVRSQAPAETAAASEKEADDEKTAKPSDEDDERSARTSDKDDEGDKVSARTSDKDDEEQTEGDKGSKPATQKISAPTRKTTPQKPAAKKKDKKVEEPATRKADVAGVGDKKKKKKKEDDDKSAPPPSSFDKRAAIAALQTAASASTACRRLDGPTGTGRATVTFAPSGRVINVSISGGKFNGTSVGSCVAGVFRRAKIPSFNGGSVTVAKSFTIPK
jgi:outer membrane biosynthesis protein TonB